MLELICGIIVVLTCIMIFSVVTAIGELRNHLRRKEQLIEEIFKDEYKEYLNFLSNKEK